MNKSLQNFLSGTFIFSIIVGLLIWAVVVSCEPSSPCDQTSKTVASTSTGMEYKIPRDGNVHVLYVDRFGRKIKGKCIEVGNSYTTHIVWIENSDGAIIDGSVSTH